MILWLLFVAGLIDADLLIVLSDIDGLYTSDPRDDETAQLIKVVEEITPEIIEQAGGTKTKLGSGGMVTKLEAAKIASNSGIPMLVTNGSREGVIRETIKGINPGPYLFHGSIIA